MSVTFRIKASEAHGRRLDPECHHALRRTRIRSTYPSAKLLSLSYFRTGGTPSTAHPEYWNGSISWVSAKDFKAFRFEDSEDHVTELALAEINTVYGWICVDESENGCSQSLFYIRRTSQNGWSRNSLLNWLSTDLYEREGAAQTNFELTMPSDDCDLARQIVKDPQNFEVFGLSEKYSETELKTSIVANIESTLMSFGKGVAFLGREYPVEVGGETKNIDLLFYIVPLHRYLVVEVKTGKYEPADLGQLSGYLAMIKHVLNTPEDNHPIGLLICKEHNRILAKYHLEELGLPMGITNYQLKRILPTQAQLAKCYADAERQMAEKGAAK